MWVRGPDYILLASHILIECFPADAEITCHTGFFLAGLDALLGVRGVIGVMPSIT
jgi:hypothetical protein